MKTATILKMVSVALIFSTQAFAQTWHPKKEGMDVTTTKAVYGEGTSIIVGNSSNFSGVPVYYRPDSTTPFAGSASNFGLYNSAYTQAIVKCHDKIFVGTGNGGIYKSSDLGQTWTPTGETDIAYGLYSDGTTLIGGIGAGIGSPKQSTDDGATWTSIPNFTGALAVSFLKHNGVIYVGTTNGLQYTSDNGATWHTVSSPSAMTATSIVGLTVLNGSVYAANNAGAYKSTDDGATWSSVITEDFTCLVTIDTVLMGGTAGHGIQMSDKNGGGWHQINAGLPFAGTAAFDAIYCISSNDQFVIATTAAVTAGDSGIYVTSMAGLGLTAGGSSTGVKVEEKAKDVITVVPNPSNGIFTIKWNDNKKAMLKVYDMNGRLVLSNEQAPANVQIDMTAFPIGNYLLKLEKPDGSYSQKLSVVK